MASADLFPEIMVEFREATQIDSDQTHFLGAVTCCDVAIMTSNLTKQHETIGVVFLFDVMLLSIPSCLAYTDCTFAIHTANPLLELMLLNIIFATDETKQLRRIFLVGFVWICPKQSTRSLGYMHIFSIDQRSRVFFQHAACINTIFHNGCVQVTRLPHESPFNKHGGFFFASESPRVHHFPTSFPPGHWSPRVEDLQAM